MSSRFDFRTFRLFSNFQIFKLNSIQSFELKNNKGTIVTILNYGAIISSFKIKNSDGSYNDIVLGFDDPAEYLREDYLAAYPYFGAAIGRYANRIGNARFFMDGQDYQLTANSGINQLHGGHTGFDKKLWELIQHSEQQVSLRYLSKDGEEGFPGDLETIIHFSLTNDDELRYEYEAHTNKPTAVNLTHHSYFNLNNGDGNIGDHEVFIDGTDILEQDENYVATGKLIPVKDTAYDFNQYHTPASRWNEEEGYDQSYIINQPSLEKPAASLRSPDAEFSLEIFTDEPVVHFYTGKYIPSIPGRNGQPYFPFCGLCFETQQQPNAINIDQFPSTVLRPGEKYHTTTVYKIVRKEN